MTLEQAKAKGITILDKPPAGWIERNAGGTEPRGYHWWFNGKSIFGDGYEDALVKTQQEAEPCADLDDC